MTENFEKFFFKERKEEFCKICGGPHKTSQHPQQNPKKEICEICGKRHKTSEHHNVKEDSEE